MNNSLLKKLRLLFGYLIMIVLLIGGFSSIFYFVAVLIGGDTASIIVDFIFNKVYPVMIKVSTITILFGLILMYMSGEKALTHDTDDLESEGER